MLKKLLTLFIPVLTVLVIIVFNSYREHEKTEQVFQQAFQEMFNAHSADYSEAPQTSGALTSATSVTTATTPAAVAAANIVSETTSAITSIITTTPAEDDTDRVYIPMENIMQFPELPTGCEITALTSLFRFYGYDAEKTDMARNYLPISPGNDRYINKMHYRDSFFDYFIGDPFTEEGYGCLSPAIVTAAQSYIAANDSDMEIVNISGCEPETLYELVSNGTPVMCWATMDMVPSEYRRSWYDNATGEKLDWYIKEHALILCGYDRELNIVIVNCSLNGIRGYDMDLFETRFREMYSQAVFLKKADDETPEISLRHPDPVIATARVEANVTTVPTTATAPTASTP
jgi:uncharacterized protein YvpB